ncbi:MAG: RidA family protein [Acidimicrobiales bacterium]
MTTPVGPYTPIVRAGEWLVCSGQIGIRDGALVPGDLRAQLDQALANLAALLETHGASISDIVKTTVFLVDMDDYGEMNEIYETFMATFGDKRPARSAVAVVGLPLGAIVEIEAWAYAPGL